jgi:hypothetical protein
MPTHRLAADVLPGASLYGLSHTQGLCCFGGGLPCWSAGVLLGGIGISGGSVEEDIAIATQTLARFSRERFLLTPFNESLKKRIQTGVIMSSASLVLVINCGSSSLKFSVIPRNQETPVLSGLAEKLGLREACITFNDAQGKTTSGWPDGASHTCALEALFARLAEQALLPQVCAIGHRVAHGGNDFKHSVRLTAPVIERIRELSALAPLHNPANLIGIEAAMALLPELPQVAVFDTAFHQTLPPEAYTYAIPLEYLHQHQVRRYGFHGTSHRFIAAEAVARLGLNPANHGY